MTIQELESYFDFNEGVIVHDRRFFDFSRELISLLSVEDIRNIINRAAIDLESFDDDGLDFLSSCALFRELYLSDEDVIKSHLWISKYFAGDFAHRVQQSWAISFFSSLMDMMIVIAQEILDKN